MRNGERAPSALDTYLESIRGYPLLTQSGEIRLARRTQRGENDAWRALVKGNLRLVVRIARDFQRRGVSMDDPIAEGNFGLMVAARRYDPSRGVRFVTYSAWWIRKYVLAAIERQRSQTCMPVTAQCPWRDRDDVGVRNRGTVPRRPIVSLDAPQVVSGDPVAARVASSDVAPDERVNARQEVDCLREVLGILGPRERTILEAHYGLGGKRRRSLREIARTMGCTREWVRQLERRAMHRARRLLESRVGNA